MTATPRRMQMVFTMGLTGPPKTQLQVIPSNKVTSMCGWKQERYHFGGKEEGGRSIVLGSNFRPMRKDLECRPGT
jgi:hypothetical protein